MAISMKKEQMKIYVVAATRERGQEIAHAHRHFAERVHIVSTWHEWAGGDASFVQRSNEAQDRLHRLLTADLVIACVEAQATLEVGFAYAHGIKILWDGPDSVRDRCIWTTLPMSHRELPILLREQELDSLRADRDALMKARAEAIDLDATCRTLGDELQAHVDHNVALAEVLGIKYDGDLEALTVAFRDRLGRNGAAILRAHGEGYLDAIDTIGVAFKMPSVSTARSTSMHALTAHIDASIQKGLEHEVAKARSQGYAQAVREGHETHTVKWKPVVGHARCPTRATDGAVGFDGYASEWRVLKSGAQPVKVPLGFAVELPPHLELQVRPRSGLSLNGIHAAWGTIDPDYRGEASVTMWFASSDGCAEWAVKPGDRVCQLVVAPRLQDVRWTKVDELNATGRGEGGYGSTGR